MGKRVVNFCSGRFRAFRDSNLKFYSTSLIWLTICVLIERPSRLLSAQYPKQNANRKIVNLFNANIKDTTVMSLMVFWYSYSWLWANFTPCSDVFIADFEQVNAHLECCITCHFFFMSLAYLVLLKVFLIVFYFTNSLFKKEEKCFGVNPSKYKISKINSFSISF